MRSPLRWMEERFHLFKPRSLSHSLSGFFRGGIARSPLRWMLERFEVSIFALFLILLLWFFVFSGITADTI
jgi:hypothetical protein